MQSAAVLPTSSMLRIQNTYEEITLPANYIEVQTVGMDTNTREDSYEVESYSYINLLHYIATNFPLRKY
jgi:hypothetical protein